MSGDGADEPDDLPCLQIQVDLSAMVDGELDAAGVRRVLVHADLCATCRAFPDGVRAQVRVHRAVAAAPPRRLVEPSVVAGLRDQLTKARRKLSRVLYEL
ncbi:MAG: zf-HC2 domain-containing protein, partial [Planctomycetota bacterium]